MPSALPARAAIHAVATAYPPHLLGQDDARRVAGRVFGTNPALFERLAASYGNAGIETRHSCVPLDWYLRPHGWPERARLFEAHAVALLTEAGAAVLDRAGVDPREVAAVVTVSSTGIVTPSLDALLIGPLGLASGVQRLPVFGLGCAGGVLGLARAEAMAQANPGRWVLCLCVELCSLTFRPSDTRKANIIATTLFGDGAAAVLLRVGEGPQQDARAVLEASGEHTWPASREVMGWTIEADSFGVVFSRDIPALIRAELRIEADAFLARQGLTVANLDGFILHPGGQKVIAALEEAFELAPGTLEIEREVLRRRGNMSAVTVLAVLERTLEQQRRGRFLMAALGPGFSVGFGLVHRL